MNKLFTLGLIRYICIGLFFILYIIYSKTKVSMQKSFQNFDYCQQNQDDEICTQNKFENFFLFYLDGVGEYFLQEFKNNHENKDKIYLQKIMPYGLADSIPQFKTYFSGKISMDYEVTLTGEDNFFQQCSLAQIYPRTYIYKGFKNVMDKNFWEYNDQEGRGLYHSVSKYFLEWHHKYFDNFEYKKQIIMNNLYDTKEEALEQFKILYKQNIKKLNKKKKKLYKDLNKYFKKKKQNFVYVPTIDDFCHWETQLGKNYIKGLASIIANMSVLMEYLDKKQKDTLLIVMSDHGGDESPYMQERYNHNTPYSKDNQAFFMLYNKSQINQDSFVNKDLQSFQISDILTNLLKKTNSIGWFDINYDFFQDKNQKINHYKFFERRLQFFEQQHIKIAIEQTRGNSEIQNKIQDNKIFNSNFLDISNQNFTIDDLVLYKSYLKQQSQILKNKIENYNFNFANLCSIILGVLVFMGYILPYLLYSKNKQLIVFAPVFIMIIWCLMKDLYEKIIFIFGLFFQILCYFVNQPIKRKIFIMIFILNLIVIAFYQFCLNFEKLFFNAKNFAASVIGYSVYFLVFYNIYKKNQNFCKISKISNSLGLLFIFLNIVFDYCQYYVPQFFYTPFMNNVNLIQIVIMSVCVALTPFIKSNNIEFNALLQLGNLCYYVDVLYCRLILVGLLIPFYYLVLKKNIKNYNALEKQCIYICLFLSGYIFYIGSGYYFDWRNKIRLNEKFNLLGLYRPMHMFFFTTIIALLEFLNTRIKFWDIFLGLREFDVVQGFLYLALIYNYKYEFRNACQKFLEYNAVYHGIFMYQRLAIGLSAIQKKYTKIQKIDYELS